MAKPIRKIDSLRKVSSRKNRGSRIRKNTRRIEKGIIHVQAGFHNTIVTVTDQNGQVVSCFSAGTFGFKGRRRGTAFAAQTVAENAMQAVQGMQRAEVLIKGPGVGRDAALRAILRSGILVNFIRDITPLPHNGCRRPKKRRV